MKRAVVLLSGGLDSTTLAYRMARRGVSLIGLSFDYGQRHRRELTGATRTALRLGMEAHQIMKFDLSAWKNSPLTGGEEVPLDREQEGVAPTYVPGRNLILLSFALSLAETYACEAVLIGAHGHDRAGYPDCREEFFSAFEQAGILGTRTGAEGRPIQISRPYVTWKKSSIVAEGLDLKVPYADTWTCYNGRDLACGRCDSCRSRLAAFAANGVPDPVPYEFEESQN